MAMKMELLLLRAVTRYGLLGRRRQRNTHSQSSTLKMQAVCFSETFVSNGESALRHNLEAQYHKLKAFNKLVELREI
jgi:hypothetical protein